MNRTLEFIAGQLLKAGNCLQSIADQNELDTKEDQLEPLLPVADPETYERYAAAFRTIVEEDVTCVAVTGPYGAGKTSLINAFRDHHSELKFIRISLATFEGDDKKSITSDRIEKSILQQLIYSAGRKQLEYSRFKKIRKPTLLQAKAILLSIFAIVTGASIKYWGNLEKFVAEANHGREFALAASGGLLWFALLVVILHGILKASAGLSIKKFSLKNAEIETEDKSKESVFNKHLDEIVYFFQETLCDILIVEDLDRFGKTEIFTKIREINQLINDNPDVRSRKKKPIVFLFAIRDDLFKGKDRTKFFDLLIPVIPFVSAGNAYDVLHNRLKNAGLRDALKDKFLRQVTVYVTDNRHLVNIVNEYTLYRRTLSDSNLDPNKLFAIILYKVFFPNDFGKLHMNQGVLADLVKELQEKRRKKRKEFSDELKQLRELEKKVREGSVQSQEVLACTYVGAMLRRSNGQAQAFRPKQGGDIATHANAKSILPALQQGDEIRLFNAQKRMVKTLSIAELEEDIHPGRTIEDRLREIDRATQLEGEGIATRRTALEKELRNARYISMKRLFSTEEIAEEVSGFEHGDLFVYLVTEGYLEENYHNYTSYFHKGAITQADREFVQRFNRDDEIEFDEKIDTPNEILLTLEDGLFGKPQGFNVTMVDHVLSEAMTDYRSKLVDGLKAFPNEALRFLEVYYDEGKHTKKLLGTLLEDWEDFLEAAAECENPVPHVKEILNASSNETLTALRHPCAFTQLIEGSAPNIFDLPKLAERLPLLAESGLLIGDISFPNLSVEERSAAIERVAEHALWKLTPKNVDTILAWHGVEEKAAHSKMFLSLKNARSPVFDHVERRINDFVDNCFLEADSTVSEPQEGVENLLSTQDLEENLGERVIKRQHTRVMFSHVPTCYWPTIIAERKFIIGWQNFEELFAETDDSTHLVSIFRSPDVVFELAEDRKEIITELFDFLVDFDGMDLESYKILIGPDLGKVAELPTAIENDKRLHLIRLGMIELNQEAYDWSEGNPTLRVALIEKEFSTFQENEQDWTLQEDEVAGLLKSSIPQDAKRNLLLDFGTIECGDDETLQKEVVQILASPETVIGEFSQDFVERVIKVVPKCDAAKLLARMIPLWNEVRVMSNLETIGTPYKEIAEYGKKPLIPKSDINLALAKTLHQTGYISSFKQEKNGIRIYTKGKNPFEAAS
ncbi:KAP family P-loop domain-containing protein [Neorhodopirellula lusitana]|uniref:KAP family P-loop domain-containing protein n=1 Tax=Neorhodopirellula lusitana TaxID=445327 RepID=A0ABY1PTW6_9BACT|nr:KAP family P-loop domain-containing protein [Neorhodopirellula lusitana]